MSATSPVTNSASSPSQKLATRGRRRWIICGLLIALLSVAAGSLFGFRSSPDPEMIWQQAQVELQHDRIDRAEALLARLGKLRAPTPYDWMLHAQVSMAHSRTDEALGYLARIENDPRLGSQARLMTGQLELRRHRLRYAEKAFFNALEFDPRLVQARRELIYLYGVQLRRKPLNEQFRALSEITPLTFDNVFHWCLTRNTMWEPLELSQMMARFVQEDPEDRWSRLSLAESQRELSEREAAEKTLESLPASDPEARAIRVRIALDRGDDKLAESLLADGPADHPDLARLRGRVALAHRDGSTALRNFRLAYEAEPDNRDSVFGLAGALSLVGNQEEAAKFRTLSRDYDLLGTLMQKASTPSARSDPKLLIQLGAACEAIHRYPEALSWYNLAITRDPLDKEAQQAIYRVNSAIATLKKPKASA